jgi:radical SAM protein with 4Fe4S-binding SPASM domain
VSSSYTEEIFEGFPFIVGWELTVACNMQCRHCGSSAGQPRSGELTTEEALKICDQFPALLVREVDFTGGEPLLRKDWHKIASHVIELGIDASILTNGWRLNKKQITLMKNIGIKAVGISLDGLKKTHDYIRNCDGAFESVLRSIDQIHEAGLPLNVITTVNALSLPELPAMRDLMLRTGVKIWRLQATIPNGRINSNKNLLLNPNDMRNIGDFIRVQRSQIAKDDLYIMGGDGLQYVVEEPDKTPWRGCAAGMRACGITSDGKIKGCLSMSDDLIEGDLRKNDLWDIWFDNNSFRYTRGFSPEKLGSYCNSCLHGVECKGGCTASSYCTTGDFHNDPYCHYRVATSELVTTIAENYVGNPSVVHFPIED